MSAKRILLYGLEALLFALFLIVLGQIVRNSIIDRIDQRIEAQLEALEQNIVSANETAQDNLKNGRSLQESIASLSLYFLDHNGIEPITPEALSSLKNAFSLIDVYLADSRGKIRSSSSSGPWPDFSGDTFAGLWAVSQEDPVSDVVFCEPDTKGGHCYCYVSAWADADSILLIKNDWDDLYQLQDRTATWKTIFSRSALNRAGFLVAVDANGTIRYDSTGILNEEDEERIQRDRSNMRKDGWHGMVEHDGRSFYTRCMYLPEVDTYLYGAYPYSEIRHALLFQMVIFGLSVLVILLGIQHYVILLMSDELGSEVWKTRFSRFRRKTPLLFLLGTVIIFGCAVYIEILSSYISHEKVNKNDLDMIADSVDRYEQTKKSGYQIYEDYIQLLTLSTAALATENPNILNTKDLKDLTDKLGVKHILVYDRNGVVIASDRNYNGLKILRDQDTATDLTTAFGWLLYGKDFLLYPDEDEAYLGEPFLFAGAPVMEKDGSYNGFVQLAFSKDLRERLVSSTTLHSVLSSFSEDLTSFVFVVDKETGEICSPNKKYDGIDVKSTRLSEREMSPGFTGFFHLNVDCLFGNCAQAKDFWVFIAMETSNTTRSGLHRGLVDTLCTLFFAFFLFLLLFSYSRWGKQDLIDHRIKEGDTGERLQENEFASWRRFLGKEFFVLSIVATIVLLFRQVLFKPDSMMYYVVNVDWAKSPDVFSLTLCILYCYVIYFVGVCLLTGLEILGKLLPPLEETLVRMQGSFFKYLIALGTVFVCADRLGAPAVSLLASAGILTVVVGLGAQSLITDILAGLLLIFEKALKAGDIIKINDCTGKVLEIGIRYTKLLDVDENNVKIINNSTIKTIINYSLLPALCNISIEVMLSDNLPEIEKLIQDALPEIRQKNPEIQADILYAGIERLTTDSAVLKLTATCDTKNATHVKRSIQRALIRILKDSGITAKTV